MFEHLDAYNAMLRDMMTKCAGVRRPGAAALDLAAVAAGRFDGFWEIGLSPWDMAAGVLLITEAGGLVGDFEGNDKFMESGQIVAGEPEDLQPDAARDPAAPDCENDALPERQP